MDDIDFLDQAPIANNITADVNDSFLSESEKEQVKKIWDSGATSTKQIVQAVCGPNVDGRSKKGIAIKDYLASLGYKARPAHIYKKKTDDIKLTDDQKEFIVNNVAHMNLLEVARTVFNDSTILNLSAPFRVVKEYYDTLDLKVKTAQNDDVDIKEYNPPKREEHAIARVKKYVLDAIDEKQISPRQLENLKRLIRYMHTFRFLLEIRGFSKTTERELYESSFVRYTWDKPDLTEEDIDLYLNLCGEQVYYQRMKEELTFLIEERDTQQTTDQKMSMALVEAIGKLRSDLDDSFKKQEKTLQALNGRRDKRLELATNENLSFLSLVEAVRDSEKRKRFAELTESRKNKVRSEADRLESLGEDLFELFGASKLELTE